MMEITKSWLLIASVFLVSCSKKEISVSQYREEAQAYCNVHTIEYWKDKGMLQELNSLSPTEKQKRLTEEISSTLKSDEMKKVISKKSQELSAQEFYPYLQEAIPRLTKEPFECEAIKSFYVSGN